MDGKKHKSKYINKVCGLRIKTKFTNKSKIINL